MSPSIKAVIDVGTNSVKLLVAEIEDEQVRPKLETSIQTRLGRGFYKTHQLQRAAIIDTAEAIRKFIDRAREMGAGSIRVIATSAAREAKNIDELVQTVRDVCNEQLEVITGDEEATLVYRGVHSGVEVDSGTMMIVDVGGGSTEIIVGSGQTPEFHQSYQMGTVRLMDSHPHADPPTAAELAEVRHHLAAMIEETIRPDLDRLLSSKIDIKLVGTGGTTTVLARMHNRMTGFDRDVIENTVLTKREMDDWMSRLWGLSEQERRKIVGLPSEKADVILTGLAIYESILGVVPCDKIHISLRGLRFGALLSGEAN